MPSAKATETFPGCEKAETLMHRIAVEIGAAATDFAAIESRIAKLVGNSSQHASDDIEHLQTLDRLTQHLRALEAFLFAAQPCSCGRIDVEAALDHVWLEAVRARLGGFAPVKAAASEAEFW